MDIEISGSSERWTVTHSITCGAINTCTCDSDEWCPSEEIEVVPVGMEIEAGLNP